MALPPLPESNTERWWLRYSHLGAEHTMLMRVADERTAAEVAEAFDTFLQAISDGMTVITIVGLEHAAAGSNVTNPEDSTGLAANYGTGAGNVIDLPLEVTFPGRSRDGRKNLVSIFGWAAQNDSSWRKTGTEDANVLAGLTALNGLSASGFFVSISGQRVIRNAYANIGYNDHWIKSQRKKGSA